MKNNPTIVWLANKTAFKIPSSDYGLLLFYCTVFFLCRFTDICITASQFHTRKKTGNLSVIHWRKDFYAGSSLLYGWHLLTDPQGTCFYRTAYVIPTLSHNEKAITC